MSRFNSIFHLYRYILSALVSQDAFTENMQHFQKVLFAYLNKRSDGDSACAVRSDHWCMNLVTTV